MLVFGRDHTEVVLQVRRKLYAKKAMKSPEFVEIDNAFHILTGYYPVTIDRLATSAALPTEKQLAVILT